MEDKKVFEMNWWSIAIILILLGGGIFFASKSARLSKKDAEHIAAQAKLEVVKDSLQKKASTLEVRVKVLEADVQQANKNTASKEKEVLSYRNKYLALKDQPTVHDTVKLQECDQLVLRYDNWITILKANVLSYSKLSDTLRIENTYLTDALKASDKLISDQREELVADRAKLKRSKIFNWSFGGLAAGMLIVLIAQ